MLFSRNQKITRPLEAREPARCRIFYHNKTFAARRRTTTTTRGRLTAPKKSGTARTARDAKANLIRSLSNNQAASGSVTPNTRAELRAIMAGAPQEITLPEPHPEVPNSLEVFGVFDPLCEELRAGAA